MTAVPASRPAVARPGPKRAVRVLLALVLVVAIAWVVTHRELLGADSWQSKLVGLGPWAAPAFVAAYVLGAVLFVPGSVLTIAGGAVFGPLLGALFSLIGATLGAAAAFLLSRFVASELVARKAGPRIHQVLDGVARRGWRFVAFVRLVPFLPYNGLNYVLGLAPLRLMSFVLTSFLCMAPGAAVFAFLGHAGRELAAGNEGALRLGLVAFSLLVALALLPRLVKRRAGSRLGPIAGPAAGRDRCC